MCEILGFANESVYVRDNWAVSLTIFCRSGHSGTICKWSGDLGEHFELITTDGRQILTSWDEPGTKELTAVCEGIRRDFTVVVKRCEIIRLESSASFLKFGEKVFLEAKTRAVSEPHPETDLEWNGDLGTSLEFIHAALISTSWDSPGSKEVTVRCGSGNSRSFFLLVLPLTHEEDLKLEKPDQARQGAKQAATEASFVMNKIAVDLGVASLLLGSPVLAQASFVSWYCSNRCAELTNDPPLNDFDIVSLFEDPAFDLPTPADDTQARLQELIAKVTSLAVCMSNLIKSFQRLDGAFAAGISIDGLQFTPEASAQAAAVSENAARGVELVDDLSPVAPVNETWQALKRILEDHDVDPSSLSSEDIRTQLETVWKEQEPLLPTQLGLSDDDRAVLVLSVDVGINGVQDRVRSLPEVLFDDQWVSIFEDLSEKLKVVAKAYEGLMA